MTSVWEQPGRGCGVTVHDGPLLLLAVAHAGFELGNGHQVECETPILDLESIVNTLQLRSVRQTGASVRG